MYHKYMKEYLSHFSAAEMWDIPCIEAVIGFKTAEAGSVDITVSEQNARFRNHGKRVHSCQVALPDGAVTIRNERVVSSPELVFLELAYQLSFHRLILLGLQLCSHPAGSSSEAITTKQKLEVFLARTPGYRGHSKAVRALKYIENGSASIMESLVYMILTLPHALGGYGLGGAVFNHEIKLNREAQKRLGQNRCFADLYYKQAKLAVEYDSFTYHSTPSGQGKDMIRSAVLERQGFGVMHLSTIQLYEEEAIRDFACNLAARLGKQNEMKKLGESRVLFRFIIFQICPLPVS